MLAGETRRRGGEEGAGLNRGAEIHFHAGRLKLARRVSAAPKAADRNQLFAHLLRSRAGVNSKRHRKGAMASSCRGAARRAHNRAGIRRNLCSSGRRRLAPPSCAASSAGQLDDVRRGIMWPLSWLLLAEISFLCSKCRAAKSHQAARPRRRRPSLTLNNQAKAMASARQCVERSALASCNSEKRTHARGRRSFLAETR